MTNFPESIKKTLLSAILLGSFLISSFSFSQNNNFEAASYNIGVGAIFSGIGAAINKEKHQPLGKVFLKGMAQGALGGYLVYESKNLISRIAKHEKLEYAWPAKLVNSAGLSVIENAASNRNFWEQYNLNIGFNRIEYHTTDNFQVKYRIMPAAMLLTASMAVGNKMEWGRSLRSGEVIFSDAELRSREFNTSVAGVASGTSTIIRKDYLENYNTIAHEFIHIYQYYDFNVFNAFVNIPLNRLNESSGFFQAMDRIFHYDFQHPFKAGLSKAQNWNLENLGDRYERNIFEIEADYYADKFQ